MMRLPSRYRKLFSKAIYVIMSDMSKSTLYLLILLFLLTYPVHAQETLPQRQKAFHAVLNKSKTDDGKILKAQELAKDVKSRFRIDAINYLIDEEAATSGPLMARLAKDVYVREFAIYALGEFETYESTPLLIHYMNDENRNVRGNAFRALQKMYPKEFDFEYHHDDDEPKRKGILTKVDQWWRANHDQYKNKVFQDMSEKDKKDAQDRWEKYGKEYLSRPKQ